LGETLKTRLERCVGRRGKIFFLLLQVSLRGKGENFPLGLSIAGENPAMTKRVRALEDPDQPAGVEGADRCVFWSGEQNRWVDVISTWIMSNDPWKDETPHGFAIFVEGDVCIPVNSESCIRIQIPPFNRRVTVSVRMSAVLWKELSSGWEQFARQVRKMVFNRCDMVKCCSYKFVKANCHVCTGLGTSLSWGSLILCVAMKRLAAEGEDIWQEIQPE